MEFEVIVKTPAEQDITDTLEWYIEQAEHLSVEWLADFELNLKFIAQNPQLFQKRYGQIRIVFLEKFPYGIYYTVQEKTIFVQAVLHTSRNPKIGKSRIKQ